MGSGASDFMPTRHFVSSEMFWGGSWSILLFAIAVWWGTSTFRKENA